MILPIYTDTHEILRKKAQPVSEVNDEIRKLVADMRETMRNADGIGLAAPQIGKSIALIVVEHDNPDFPRDSFPFTALINPRVTWFSSHKVPIVEACLSIPGIEAEIHRPDKVRVKGLNEYGQPVQIEAKGLFARVLQHEIDHLQGILFTSYVPKKALKAKELVNYPRI